MKKLIFSIFLVSMMLLNSGCFLLLVGAGVGAGTAHIKGKVKHTLQTNLDRAHRATVKAMKDLNFMLIKNTQSTLDAELTYRTAKDEKIKILLDRVGDNAVHIEILVDIFGNEELSQTILEEIKKNI